MQHAASNVIFELFRFINNNLEPACRLFCSFMLRCSGEVKLASQMLHMLVTRCRAAGTARYKADLLGKPSDTGANLAHCVARSLHVRDGNAQHGIQVHLIVHLQEWILLAGLAEFGMLHQSILQIQQ